MPCLIMPESLNSFYIFYKKYIKNVFIYQSINASTKIIESAVLFLWAFFILKEVNP